MCLGLYTVLAIVTCIMLGMFGIFMMAFIFNVVLCLQYCNFYTLRKIKSGFKLCGTTEQKKLAAKCLKIKLTPNNTISNSPKIVYEKKICYRYYICSDYMVLYCFEGNCTNSNVELII